MPWSLLLVRNGIPLYGLLDLGPTFHVFAAYHT